MGAAGGWRADVLQTSPDPSARASADFIVMPLMMALEASLPVRLSHGAPGARLCHKPCVRAADARCAAQELRELSATLVRNRSRLVVQKQADDKARFAGDPAKLAEESAQLEKRTAAFYAKYKLDDEKS